MLVRCESVVARQRARLLPQLRRRGWRRVIDISSDRAVVEFRTCIGEIVERATTGDPAVIGYLRAAPRDGRLTA